MPFIRKPKAILIAVSAGFSGYGDFLFALKLSEQLRQKYVDAGAETPPIYLVSQPEGKDDIQRLKGDTEFNVTVLTPDELKVKVDAKEIDVGTLIEGPVFNSELITSIDAALANAGSMIPLIMLPEYGFNERRHRELITQSQSFREKTCKHLTYADTVYSGFKKSSGETGILLSEALVHPASPDVLVSQLDQKISSPLLMGSDLLNYQATTELAMQYSHDIYDEDFRIPANHFLSVHCEFSKYSFKNQDVVMVGKEENSKREALESIKDKLIANGFTRITFVNADTRVEEVLHDSEAAEKTYRVIYAPGMSHQSMIACYGLSGPLSGATGDQSLGEALSSNKLIMYECLSHKAALIQSYDAAMGELSREDPEVIDTLRLLRNLSSDTECQDLGARLRDQKLREKLQIFNKAVLERDDFVTEIVKADEKWEWLQGLIICQFLYGGEQQRALDWMIKYQGRISITDSFEGKTFLQHAIDNNPAGVCVGFYYIQQFKDALIRCNQQKALEVIAEYKQVSDMDLMGCMKTSDASLIKETIAHDPDGVFAKNCAVRDMAAALESHLSRMAKFDQYQPTPKRATMHQSFMYLTNTFKQTGTYDQKAFIGLLLLNKKSIASEFYWLKPNGKLFGDKLYSICEEVLKELGVNTQDITPEKEREYYQALDVLTREKPDDFGHKWIVQALKATANTGCWRTIVHDLRGEPAADDSNQKPRNSS